jgi:hypothetical protein
MHADQATFTHYTLRITHHLKMFCGARADVNTLLSNKSPPEGFTLAVIAFVPSLYVKRYSPVGCFFDAPPPASKNLNNPHVPGYFNVDDPLCELLVLGCGFTAVFAFVFVLLNELVSGVG